MVETVHERPAARSVTFAWHVLARVEVLPALAAFLGSAWFSVVVGGGGWRSWLAGIAFSAFAATLTAAVGASRWYQQWRSRSRLRHLHRLRDEGMLTDAEVERRRQASGRVVTRGPVEPFSNRLPSGAAWQSPRSASSAPARWATASRRSPPRRATTW